MITRRGFISMLTIGAGAIALPCRSIFLPPKRMIFMPSRLHEADMAGDFNIADMRVKCTERYSIGWVGTKEMIDDSTYEAIGRRHAEALRQSMAQSYEEGISRYLTSNTAWFVKPEHEAGIKRVTREERIALLKGVWAT